MTTISTVKSMKHRLHLAGRFILKNWHITTTLIILAIVGLVLIYLYRNAINPDGISYIQSARYWAEFNFKFAINGYWSPLLSWMIVPFIWIGAEPLHAFRFINFVVALSIPLLLFAVLRREKTTTNGEKITQLLYVTSFGILLQIWASQVVTPDLLSGAVLTIAIFMTYRYLAKPSIATASFLGLSLSLLYFSKSIGFYVSLAILFLLISYKFFFAKKLPLKLTLLPLIIFTLLSGLWIGAISLKYDKPTMSTASDYNLSLIGPNKPPHPHLLPGYKAPISNKGVSVWDDPSYTKMPRWEILEHKEYYMSHVLENTQSTINLLFSLTPLIFIGIWGLLMISAERALRHTGLMLLAVSSLVVAIYSLLYPVDRYLWLIAIPIIAFGLIYLLQLPRSKTLFYNIFLLIPCLLAALSFIQTIQDEQLSTRNDEKNLWVKSALIIDSKSKVAGPTQPANKLHYYCYFTQTLCAGLYNLSSDATLNKKTISTMKKRGIKYYIDPSPARKNIPLPVVFAQKSPQRTCYYPSTGKVATCPNPYLTVYSLE